MTARTVLDATALEVVQAFGLMAVMIVISAMLTWVLIIFGGPLFERYLKVLEQKRQELKEELDES